MSKTIIFLLIIFLFFIIGCDSNIIYIHADKINESEMSEYIVIDDTDLIEEKESSEYVVIDDRDIADDDYKFVIKEAE